MKKIEKSVELAKEVKDFIRNSGERFINIDFSRIFEYDDDDIVFVKKEMAEEYINLLKVEKVDEEFISKNLVKEEPEYEELPENIRFSNEKSLYIDGSNVMLYDSVLKELRIRKEFYKNNNIVISKKPTLKNDLIPGRWYVCVGNNEKLLSSSKKKLGKYVLHIKDDYFAFVKNGQVKYSKELNVRMFNFHLIYDKGE